MTPREHRASGRWPTIRTGGREGITNRGENRTEARVGALTNLLGHRRLAKPLGHRPRLVVDDAAHQTTR